MILIALILADALARLENVVRADACRRARPRYSAPGRDSAAAADPGSRPGDHRGQGGACPRQRPHRHLTQERRPAPGQARRSRTIGCRPQGGCFSAQRRHGGLGAPPALGPPGLRSLQPHARRHQLRFRRSVPVSASLGHSAGLVSPVLYPGFRQVACPLGRRSAHRHGVSWRAVYNLGVLGFSARHVHSKPLPFHALDLRGIFHGHHGLSRRIQPRTGPPRI